MKNVWIILFMALTLEANVNMNTNYEMQPASMTPMDGFLYWWFDRGVEPVEIWVAGVAAWLRGRDVEEARALKMLEIAEERVAEIRVVVEANRTEHVRELSEDYQAWIGEVRAVASQIPNATTLQERLVLATKIHEVVLNGVIEIVPEHVRQAIQRALMEAEAGRENALASLEKSGFDAERIQEEASRIADEWSRSEGQR
jgi:hypothetical protein